MQPVDKVLKFFPINDARRLLYLWFVKKIKKW
jgi:hypothetical protein